MAKNGNISLSVNSKARFRNTLLRLMMVDAKDRVNIILGEVIHTKANAVFFACCKENDDSPSVYLRTEILNASRQLEKMLRDDERKINELLIDLSEADKLKECDKQKLMTSIFMNRDAVLDNLDKRLKSLSWIQHALSQELEAKPSYSPHLPIFKRREQQRVKEALISLAQNNQKMVEGFFEKYMDKVRATEDDKSIKNIRKNKLRKGIIIVWEHFNTTKYGTLDKDLDSDHNSIILRVPQYFMDQKLYFPHVTHELVHLEIKNTRLFNLKHFTTLRRTLYLIFRDNPLYDDRETEKWIDNLLEEIFADVISIALEGFSYLMSLYLTLVGQYHRHLLNRSMPPELHPFPWWLRLKMVLQYARIAFPENCPWVGAMDRLIDIYREQLRFHFGFEPQQTNLNEIMDYEQYICNVLTAHLQEYINEIFNVREKIQEEEKISDNCPINYYNLRLNKHIIDAIKSISNAEYDYHYTKALDRILESGIYYNINNIIWHAYIQSVLYNKYSGSKKNYYPLGAIFRLCYDHLELSKAWQHKKLGLDVSFEDVKIKVIDDIENKLYEGFFIKGRVDSAIKIDDDNQYCLLVENDSKFVDKLKAKIEGLPDKYGEYDLRVFKCLTSYDFFFIRKGVTTRELIKDCPVLNLTKITTMASYSERRILALSDSIVGESLSQEPDKKEQESQCYSLVMEVRLSERWMLNKYMERLIKDLRNKSNIKRYEKADIYISLDWQDIIILIEGIAPSYIGELLQMYEKKIPLVNRTESSILIKSDKFEELLDNGERVPHNFTILVYLRINSLNRKHDISRKLEELAEGCGCKKTFGFFPGVYDGFFQWGPGAEYIDIFAFLRKATRYLSDCKFEVVIRPPEAQAAKSFQS